MTLHDRSVLVVGGTSGLGLAVAREALARGARVTIASRRESSVDRALGELGAGASGTLVDVQDDASIAAMLRTAGDVDHLVYTAGEPLESVLLADATAERARRIWETRFVGALNTVRVAVGSGALAPRGSIVLTSGTAAHRAGAGWALTSSVVGAIDTLTRQLAIELAPRRVNCVTPGVTRSPLWSALDEASRDAMYDEIGAAIPAGRVPEPADVALAYVYAMEQELATGTSLVVDGGYLAS